MEFRDIFNKCIIGKVHPGPGYRVEGAQLNRYMEEKSHFENLSDKNRNKSVTKVIFALKISSTFNCHFEFGIQNSFYFVAYPYVKLGIYTNKHVPHISSSKWI